MSSRRRSVALAQRHSVFATRRRDRNSRPATGSCFREYHFQHPKTRGEERPVAAHGFQVRFVYRLPPLLQRSTPRPAAGVIRRFCVREDPRNRAQRFDAAS